MHVQGGKRWPAALFATAILVSAAGLLVWNPAALTQPAPAVTPGAAKELDLFAEELSKRIRGGDLGPIFDHIRTKASPAIAPELKRFEEAMRQSRESLQPRSGKPLGEVELIRKDGIGTSFARYQYIERFERGVIVWTVNLYRSATGWIVHDFTVRDKDERDFK